MDKKKLTPEQQFFNDKTLEFTEELYNQNEEKLLEAYKGQIKNRDDLLSKIAKILLSYNIADNILSINAADKKKLYSDLSDLIVNNIKSELDFETSLTKDILTSVGKEKFNTNNYEYSLGADFKLTHLSDETLKKIINTKVDDKLWSDRLYTNKNDMCMTLQDEIEKFLKGETNVNQIEQKIIDRYDTNKYETERLVQDNICRVQEGANDVWQHEHGIKKVMYLATLDGKVCSKCAQYDTKVFDIDKKPIEIPQHPFCRCVYISLVNENWRPKMRLDNETKQNINWQSYQEWEKENMKSTGSIGKIHKNDDKRKEDHANRYYESIRNRKDDIISISNNTGINMSTIQKIKEHVFFNKYHLVQGYTNFAPDYDMALAWQRLVEGKNIKNSDIVLLHHERLESYLMNKYNYKYEDAHSIVCRKYNYVKALMED